MHGLIFELKPLMPALFALLITCAFLPFHWLEFFSELSTPFYSACLELAPGGPWQNAYQALVCGKNLPQDSFFQALKDTSLLHLAIVSGSHLLLLEVLLRRGLGKRPSADRIVLLAIFLYCLITGWQAPAVRSLFSLSLQLLAQRKRLYWSALQSTWYSGLLTWSFFPQWAHSFSFLLSWGASLGLASLPQSKGGFFSEWRSHLSVYLLLSPLLLPLTLPHPLTVLCNWFVGPLLGQLLFPMSFLIFIVPALQPLGDFIWLGIAKAIGFLSQWTPSFDFQVSTPPLQLWVYIFLLQFTLQALQSRQKR